MDVHSAVALQKYSVVRKYTCDTSVYVLVRNVVGKMVFVVCPPRAAPTDVPNVVIEPARAETLQVVRLRHQADRLRPQLGKFAVLVFSGQTVLFVTAHEVVEYEQETCVSRDVYYSAVPLLFAESMLPAVDNFEARLCTGLCNAVNTYTDACSQFLDIVCDHIATMSEMCNNIDKCRDSMAAVYGEQLQTLLPVAGQADMKRRERNVLAEQVRDLQDHGTACDSEWRRLAFRLDRICHENAAMLKKITTSFATE